MAGIVVGMDRSAHAVDALRFAIEEARYRGCGLTAVEVWEVPYLAEDIGEAALALDEAAHRRAEQELREQVEKALDGKPVPPGLQVETRAGNPSEVLIQLGQAADLLVLGARGRGGFRHLLTGSVATQVIHHAPCPVVVVPGRRGPAATGE
ncbi:universal stress protein [Pseudonocardia nigra]|uniref:universal stress protein n=1 Tax=Pseudonocardia nigra TaxID=1921578 RepID=UPI001C5EAFDA|nr:universal stress protein [Pseudonocardia nigra]